MKLFITFTCIDKKKYKKSKAMREWVDGKDFDTFYT